MTIEQLGLRWLLPPASFCERLSGYLTDVCGDLSLTWAAILELGIEGGQLEPRWLAASPDFPSFPAPTLQQFLQLRSEVCGGEVFAQHSWNSDATMSFPLGRPLGLPEGHAVSFPDEGEPSRAWALLVVQAADPHALQEPLRPVLAQLGSALEQHQRRALADAVLHAVEQAPDAIELTDQDARLLYVNQAWARYFDYSRHDTLGHTTGALVRDDENPAHDRAFLQFTLAALHRRDSWLGVMGSRSRLGQRRFNEVSVSPFEDAQSGRRGNFAIRRDLSHRADRDAALASAHQEFRSVLAAMPDAVVVLRDTVIYFCNAAFLNMVKQSSDAIIGAEFISVVHPEDRDRFARSRDGGEVTPIRIHRTSGESRLAEISSAGNVSFEGHTSRILIARDVTEHSLTREQLARTERLAALGALAAGVAHEINNPLAYVTLNLESLHGQGLASERLEAVDEALDGARRIRQIVAELRGFWNADAQQALTLVDVSSAVTSAANLAQNEIRHRAELVREHEHHLFAHAREGQLVQVLVNLLVNAAQAIPDGDGGRHTIRVCTRSISDERLEITVSDTGTGIDASALATVFHPFTTTRGQADGAGGGLGLAISRRIVEELHGSIDVLETGPAGTTLRVELPRAFIEEPVAASETRLSQLSVDTQPYRVLVVDDEPLVARAIRRALGGHEVHLAGDGIEALSLFELDGDFDVVLCDLMMPRMSGAELYHAVEERVPQLADRFVFMTGGAFSGWSRRFLETVERPVIEKPFEPHEIRARVEDTAHRSRARRRQRAQ